MYRGRVIVLTTPRLARFGRLARLAVLLLFALFVAHDAVYVAQYGFGARYAAAMTAVGHDAWFAPASLIIGSIAALVATVAVLRLGRLTIRSSSVPCAGSAFIDVGPSYLQELRSTWLRLFPAVVVLFTLQENAEAALSGHPIPGLDLLFGAGSGLVLPILAMVTFLLAVLGAAVRWRTRVLLARARITRRHPRPAGRRVAPAWVASCAAVAHEWMLDRLDAGRAPPQIAV